MGNFTEGGNETLNRNIVMAHLKSKKGVLAHQLLSTPQDRRDIIEAVGKQ